MQTLRRPQPWVVIALIIMHCKKQQWDKAALIETCSFFPSKPLTMCLSLCLFCLLQPSNPIDVAARPGAVPHTLLQKDPRVSIHTSLPPASTHVWYIQYVSERGVDVCLRPILAFLPHFSVELSCLSTYRCCW